MNEQSPVMSQLDLFSSASLSNPAPSGQSPEAAVTPRPRTTDEKTEVEGKAESGALPAAAEPQRAPDGQEQAEAAAEEWPVLAVQEAEQSSNGAVVVTEEAGTAGETGAMSPAENTRTAGAKTGTGSKRGRKSLKELADDPEVLQQIGQMDLAKQYYPISEVAEMFRVNASLIRYWENEFDVLKPRKNKKGDRLFRPEDIRNLQLIYHLLRERKYTIEGARQKLKSEKKLAMQHFELVQSLQKVRKFLVELREQL
ncbi:MerR family transcriptional regulator [Compostibacter hankyongensis]|uniref:HTH merR-type domain-containing protein n=1 Tax=Compostibacter hankyongensis TaxID=1007089 RepID=A0ABP8FDJ9_9BACT